MMADIKGISLHYAWHRGSTENPLVLLHEMGGSHASWDAVVKALPENQTVLRPDLRGFGLSEKPVGVYSLTALAEDILDLMEEVRLPQAHIAGCAIGAAVAIEMARLAPHKVIKLTLCAPATGIAPEKRQAALALASHFRRQGVRSFLERDTFPQGWPPELIPRGKTFAQFCAIQLSSCPETLAKYYEMLAETDCVPALRNLDCPIHIVAGRHDKVRTTERLQALSDTLRLGQFSEIESGHFMALQTPVTVARLLTGDACMAENVIP